MLIEIIVAHTELLDRALRSGVNLDDVFELYAVIHALQIHAQASIDYLLYTCAVLKKGS
ncbi:hypothetical protein [Pyrobaculum aerophilum]|uniref:hypothetical protein n=1 Tax=Pyrobaculum aerophilum TaxID=13773 RepID=UPI002161E602|nr:hypothetical protein [Pyrobaculum aerophilum]